MKKVDEVQLRTFEASSMELVALGSAILQYSRSVRELRDAGQKVTFEQEQVVRLLSSFYGRLVGQLDLGTPIVGQRRWGGGQ
jgi:hypothetical protein